MPKIPLPIILSRLADEGHLPIGVGARLINGYINRVGNVPVIRKFFGMELLLDTGASYGVDGMFWWDALGCVVFVVNGNIYKMTTASGNYTNITGDALSVVGPTTFATTGTYSALASGGRMVMYKNGSITAPGACTATLIDTTGNYIDILMLSPGDYTYKICFMNDNGITEGGTISNTVTADSTHRGVTLSAIPTCTDGYCTARVIYRTTAGGSSYYKVATLSDNTTTTYEDYISDETISNPIPPPSGFDTTAMPTTGTATYQTFFLADADAPTTVNFVDYMDWRMLALQSDSKYAYYSDVNSPLSWGSTSYFNPESKADNSLALHVHDREITIFGRESIDPYYNDGVTPFSRLEGAFVERGLLATHSVAYGGGAYYFLDNDRHIVSLTGRTPAILSSDYDEYIRGLKPVADARGMFISVGQSAFYILTFPTAKFTLAYNVTTGSFSELGDWDYTNAEFTAWKGQCYCYAKDWDIHLVGDKASGKIYKLVPTSFQNDGETIRTVLRTGTIDHGNTDQKIGRELRLKYRRGQGLISGTEPVFQVRWRNEGGPWGMEHSMSLGKIGEYENVARMHRLGAYRSRQYEFIHTDNSDFQLYDIEEEV